jgi:hypothetical protein
MVDLKYSEMAGLICGSFLFQMHVGENSFFSMLGGATLGALIIFAYKVMINRDRVASFNFSEMAGLIFGSFLFQMYAGDNTLSSVLGGATLGALFILGFKVIKKRHYVTAD